MLTYLRSPANDNQPPDPEWRAELLDRAPSIVARAMHSSSAGARVAAEWWRREFVAEFGRDPVKIAKQPPR